MDYYWVRIYDYKYEKELEEIANNSEIGFYEKYKGVLLDEYYLSGEELERNNAKKEVCERSQVNKFAKARKNQDCIYAIVMESNKFFYDRFTKEIDTVCFNPECQCKIKGKAKDFPSINSSYYDELLENDETYYFCSYDCKSSAINKISHTADGGEWQSKESFHTNGGVYGYIYHIYNRKTNMHYIGQTLFMPFFRWQEHIKSQLKGDICDLVFETVTEVRVKSKDYLNSIEAWWIKKYIFEYGRENVINITVPNITINDLINQYNKMFEGQINLEMKGE